MVLWWAKGGGALNGTGLRSIFRAYADAYNRSLGDSVDVEGIRASFADCFVAAGPDVVNCGRNDDSFVATLQQGYAFYRSIGTKHIDVRRLVPIAIDDRHHMVKVFYTASYEKAGTGEPMAIEFDVTYLLQTRDGASKIFAFVAGDEMGLYRRYGLVDG